MQVATHASRRTTLPYGYRNGEEIYSCTTGSHMSSTTLSTVATTMGSYKNCVCRRGACVCGVNINNSSRWTHRRTTRSRRPRRRLMTRVRGRAQDQTITSTLDRPIYPRPLLLQPVQHQPQPQPLRPVPPRIPRQPVWQLASRGSRAVASRLPVAPHPVPASLRPRRANPPVKWRQTPPVCQRRPSSSRSRCQGLRSQRAQQRIRRRRSLSHTARCSSRAVGVPRR